MKVESYKPKKEKDKEIHRTSPTKEDDLIEPEDFHIISKNQDDLTLNKEDFDNLISRLESAHYDENLARLYSKYNHQIKDLTKK
jgi:hypothetical protein